MRTKPEPRPDTRWLMRPKGQHVWHVVVYTPRPLIPVMKKRKFVASLKTGDLRTAQTRRFAALEQFRQLFESAGRICGNGTPAQCGAEPDWLASARRWRATIERLAAGDASTFGTTQEPQPGQTEAENALAVAEGVIAAEAEDVEWQHGKAAADVFTGIAFATKTPLLYHVDSWLQEGGKKGPLNPRTQAQYRSDLNDFEQWCTKHGVPTTIESISKEVAGRYVSQELVAKRVHWGTANRKITAASSYWRWLAKRTSVTVNPWSGQSLSKVSKARNGEKPKRPFTDAEVSALLAGDADLELADAMRVAALSGMRLEEIYRLTVADCAGGWFNVRQSKTDAGIRRVPIHTYLADIVARRCEGKRNVGYLFHEAGEAKDGRERSMSLSKRFGHYRQRLGVHDKAEGKRHSRVDFHSWRRWFVTKARGADIDRAVVAAVVGHEAGNLTDDVYARVADEAKRRCVEAVQFPLGFSPFPPDVVGG
jgi:integrase